MCVSVRVLCGVQEFGTSYKSDKVISALTAKILRTICRNYSEDSIIFQETKLPLKVRIYNANKYV